MFSLPLTKAQKIACQALVTMIGITRAEQEELYDLALSQSKEQLERAKELTIKYEARGAKFMFDGNGNRIYYEE